MRIAFAELDESVINSMYGGTGDTVSRMTLVDGNRIIKGHLGPGASIGTHTHTGSCEAIYILSGTGVAVCDGVEEQLAAGICHYCPEGSSHSMRNTGDVPLEYLAFVAKL